MRNIFVILLSVILLSGCVQESAQPEAPVAPAPEIEEPAIVEAEPVESHDENSRSFYLGVVPNPKGGPDAQLEDIVDSYAEAGRIAEVTMLWTNPGGIGQYNRIRETRAIEGARINGLEPVVTLEFATIKEVPGEGLKYMVDAPEGVEASLADEQFRILYIMEARSIADEFHPEYMSLGNEINDYFILNPDEYNQYLRLFDDSYAAIKEVSPETKVFVVLSYTHLIDNDQWSMIEDFDDRADLIGLTTYPWHHFESPEDIDSDYYSRIKQYTDKPIAFTEIGWTSSAEVGSSEEEQAEFLEVFLNRTKTMDMEMVNWLFLHETVISGVAGSVTDEAVGTISLKTMEGNEKEVYSLWINLKEKHFFE